VFDLRIPALPCLCLLPLLACRADAAVHDPQDGAIVNPAPDDGSREGGGGPNAQSLDAASPKDGATSPSALDASQAPSTASLASLLSRALFALLFLHQRDSACNAQLYDYDSLLSAAARFPSFATEGSDQLRRRELAAFLANISHETTGGWPSAPDGPHAWGLCLREEVGCDTGSCTQYCDSSNTEFPCAPGKTYHGRGPLQLSWNYNYGRVGKALALDLLADPGLVTRDGGVGFATALWFWMTPQPPKPSAHSVMVETWQPSSEDVRAGRVSGFGLTVNIINGALECSIPNDPRVEDRVGFFDQYAKVLGTDLGDNLRCESMKPF
jgi:chitinase